MESFSILLSLMENGEFTLSRCCFPKVLASPKCYTVKEHGVWIDEVRINEVQIREDAL